MASPTHDLVAGNRIFAHHNILDAYGHISMRDPKNPNQFIMSRNRAPEVVNEDDLMVFNFDGEVANAEDRRRPYQERFIHAAVYGARPDVHAVCHSHTPSIIPFGVTGIPLRPIFHQASALGANVPIWDLEDDFPEAASMLVTSMEMGRSLAKTLGAGRIALMRGHGCVFVGRSVPNVVSFGIYAVDTNARMATLAHLMSGGKVKYLSDRFIQPRTAPATESSAGEGYAGREWEAWCAQVGMLDEEIPPRML
jgi:HCOMODA/2-hydroxy-3-carboxy-muconic semialdehyde decarboxylase